MVKCEPSNKSYLSKMNEPHIWPHRRKKIKTENSQDLCASTLSKSFKKSLLISCKSYFSNYCYLNLLLLLIDHLSYELHRISARISQKIRHQIKTNQEDKKMPIEEMNRKKRSKLLFGQLTIVEIALLASYQIIILFILLQQNSSNKFAHCQLLQTKSYGDTRGKFQ